jgi:hypothetical protein
MNAQKVATEALATLDAEWGNHDHEPAWWVGFLEVALTKIARGE